VEQERAATDGSRIDLRDLFSLLWRQKWTIAAITAAVLATALLLSSRQTRLYDAQSSVLVEAPPGSGPQDALVMATEKLVASSAAVAEIAEKTLRLSDPPSQVLQGLSVSVPVDSQLLDFNYSHSNPKVAQQRAQVFAESYLAFRKQKLVDAALASQRSLQDQIKSLRKSLDDVQHQAGTTGDPRQQDILRTQAASLTTQIGILEQKLGDLTAAQSVSPGRILEDAVLPTASYRPDYLVNGALGVLVGLMLGTGVVLLRQYLSDRIQGAKDLESCVDAPVLSTIPAVRTRNLDRARLVTVQRSNSPAAEAFRHLRANFLVAAGSCAAKTVLITSALEEEGKTFTAANLGVALTKAGKSVILLSADLRRPTLEQVFGVSAPAGLADVLGSEGRTNGGSPVTEMWSVQPNLTVVPVGTAPDNPAELLTASNMAAFIQDLRKVADFVLIDAAPLLPVADAATVAPACDAVLIVADARSTRRATVMEAREQLDRIHAPVLGAVLVNARGNGAKPYGPKSSHRPRPPYGRSPAGPTLLSSARRALRLAEQRGAQAPSEGRSPTTSSASPPSPHQSK
jgi:polysaccharide biosynthesis transport protein